MRHCTGENRWGPAWSSDPWDRTRPATQRDIDQRVIFKIRSFMDADPFTGRSLSLDMHFLSQTRRRMWRKTTRRQKRVGLIFYFVKLILPKQVHVCEGRPQSCQFVWRWVINGCFSFNIRFKVAGIGHTFVQLLHNIMDSSSVLHFHEIWLFIYEVLCGLISNPLS